MAWTAPIDRNDGQDFDGDAWQSGIDAIEQIQDALGPDETPLPRLIETLTSPSGLTATFSSIPSGYRHLMIAGRIAHDDASTTTVHRRLTIQFNGDTASNYNFMRQEFNDDAAPAAPDISTSTNGIHAATVGIAAGSVEIFIRDYTSSAFKSAVATSLSMVAGAPGGGNFRICHGGGRWLSSAAINEVTLRVSTDQFAGGTLSLYGLP